MSRAGALAAQRNPWPNSPSDRFVRELEDRAHRSPASGRPGRSRTPAAFHADLERDGTSSSATPGRGPRASAPESSRGQPSGPVRHLRDRAAGHLAPVDRPAPHAHGSPITSSRTLVRPAFMNPSRSAAASETSMITPAARGLAAGPRSTMRTTTLAPVARLRTRTRVPNGKLGCARPAPGDRTECRWLCGVPGTRPVVTGQALLHDARAPPPAVGRGECHAPRRTPPRGRPPRRPRPRSDGSSARSFQFHHLSSSGSRSAVRAE